MLKAEEMVHPLNSHLPSDYFIRQTKLAAALRKAVARKKALDSAEKLHSNGIAFQVEACIV